MQLHSGDTIDRAPAPGLTPSWRPQETPVTEDSPRAPGQDPGTKATPGFCQTTDSLAQWVGSPHTVLAAAGRCILEAPPAPPPQVRCFTTPTVPAPIASGSRPQAHRAQGLGSDKTGRGRRRGVCPVTGSRGLWLGNGEHLRNSSIPCYFSFCVVRKTPLFPSPLDPLTPEVGQMFPVKRCSPLRGHHPLPLTHAPQAWCSVRRTHLPAERCIPAALSLKAASGYDLHRLPGFQKREKSLRHALAKKCTGESSEGFEASRT